MRIVITGGRGMLGRTLVRRLSPTHEVLPIDRDECDITDARATAACLADLRPQVVIHGAAHTQVDRCESEVELAYAINAVGSANVARAAERIGARVIAISTDYVFAGDGARPYHEWDAPAPRTVYGASKLAGEEAVRRHCRDHVVARIAWLYGPGGPSFIHTMLKLGAQAGPDLKVVDDQIGNPTSTDAVADGLLHLLEAPVAGTVHLTCEGETTWCGLTRALFAARGVTRGVQPCTTAGYPRPAPRPANSRLDKMALRIHHLPAMSPWQEALERFLREHPGL